MGFCGLPGAALWGPGGSWKQACFSHGSRASAIWIPKVVDFRSHENLDFGDPSHSLEGSRESKVDAFCRLFQLLSRASVERSPGHAFWQILDPFGNPKWLQNVPKITSGPSHEYNVDPKSPSGRPQEPPGP